MTTTTTPRRKIGRKIREKTILVLELHHAGRTPREIIRLLPNVSRDQVFGVLKYRGLVAHPDYEIDVRIDAPSERATDALCESGEVDRRAMAFKIVALGGTAQMIAVELDCEVSVAEGYVQDCPPRWMTFRD